MRRTYQLLACFSATYLNKLKKRRGKCIHSPRCHFLGWSRFLDLSRRPLGIQQRKGQWLSTFQVSILMASLEKHRFAVSLSTGSFLSYVLPLFYFFHFKKYTTGLYLTKLGMWLHVPLDKRTSQNQGTCRGLCCSLSH